MIDRLPKLADVDGPLTAFDARDLYRITGTVDSVRGTRVGVRGMVVPIGTTVEIRGAGGTVEGVATGFEGSFLTVATLDPPGPIRAGDEVVRTGSGLMTPAGDALLGRMVDARGRPIDDGVVPFADVHRPIESPPPAAARRPPIDQPLATGVRAVDAMLTCGRGQRIGIFAGSGVGKSTLLGMIARGSDAARIVIAMVGERGREVQEFVTRCLGPAIDRSTLVVATGDEPAACRVLAASTATAIAEAHRDAGHDTLLLVDSVTRLAMAQREIGLAAGEPPTTRGYPPSVFSRLPRLVERAGRTRRGSITAFYTVLVEGDEPNEPISDALRGLLDGHIMLDRSLAEAGHFPPIDVSASLSRLQPHLIDAEWSDACRRVRGHLAAHRDNADLIAIGAYRRGTDPAVDAAIAAKPRLDDLFRQSSDDVTPAEQSRAALIAAVQPPPAAADPSVETSVAEADTGRTPVTT